MLAQPASRYVTSGLASLGQRLARQTDVSEELFQNWAAVLVERGPGLDQVVVETIRRTRPAEYRQSLNLLLDGALPVPLRRQLRQALAAVTETVPSG